LQFTNKAILTHGNSVHICLNIFAGCKSAVNRKIAFTVLLKFRIEL